MANLTFPYLGKSSPSQYVKQRVCFFYFFFKLGSFSKMSQRLRRFVSHCRLTVFFFKEALYMSGKWIILLSKKKRKMSNHISKLFFYENYLT